MSHVLAVSGSPMKVSRSAVLLGHVSGILEENGHTVDTLTLRDLPAEALMHAEFDDPAIVDAAARLEKADGLIVATPVYKAAFSGLLKTWLDLLPQFGLSGKVVLPARHRWQRRPRPGARLRAATGADLDGGAPRGQRLPGPRPVHRVAGQR